MKIWDSVYLCRNSWNRRVSYKDSALPFTFLPIRKVLLLLLNCSDCLHFETQWDQVVLTYFGCWVLLWMNHGEAQSILTHQCTLSIKAEAEARWLTLTQMPKYLKHLRQLYYKMHCNSNAFIQFTIMAYQCTLSIKAEAWSQVIFFF